MCEWIDFIIKHMCGYDTVVLKHGNKECVGDDDIFFHKQ